MAGGIELGVTVSSLATLTGRTMGESVEVGVRVSWNVRSV